MAGYFSGYNDISDPTGTTNDAAGDYARLSAANPGAFAKPGIFERLFGKKSPGITSSPLPAPQGMTVPASPTAAPAAPTPAISSGAGLVKRILGAASGPPTYNASGEPLVPGTPLTTPQFMSHLTQAFHQAVSQAPMSMPGGPAPLPQPQAGGPPALPQMNPMQMGVLPELGPHQPHAAPAGPPSPYGGAGFGGNTFGGNTFGGNTFGGNTFGGNTFGGRGYFRGGPLHMMRGGYPQHLLFGMPTRYARGGPDYVQPDGRGDGRSDHVDAKLSPGEFVMDAETVSMLGNGDNEAGARELEHMRRNVREHKGRALAKGKFSPDAKSPVTYLRGKK